MTSTKYIGMDVHKESISIAVMSSAGKIVMESVIETKASMILQFIDGLRANLESGQGEVALAHSTGNPCEEDHKWIVTDAKELAELKSSFERSKAASAGR